MHKAYRYIWQSRKKGFKPPPNLAEIKPETRRQKMDSMIEGFRQQSGLSVISTIYLLLLVLIVFVGMMVLTFYLISINNPAGRILVVITPFISFSFVIYTMMRKTGLARVNEYISKNRENIENEGKCINTSVSCQFVKSKGIIN